MDLAHGGVMHEYVISHMKTSMTTCAWTLPSGECESFLISKTLILIVLSLVSSFAAHIIANSCGCDIAIK